MDIYEIKPKVNPDKTKKKRQNSNHKENKIGVHTTIGGKGIIARLRKKRNKN